MQPSHSCNHPDALAGIAAGVLDSLPHPVHVLSAPDYRCLCMNSAQAEALRAHGVAEPETCIGRHPWEFDPIWEECLQTAHDEACRSGEPRHLTGVRRPEARGASYWDISLTPRVDPETGHVTAITSVAVEVSRRVRAETAHRRALEQRAHILESITDAFIALDLEARLTFVNGEAARVLGQERGALLGQSLWDVLPEVAGTEFEREARRALEERVATTCQAYYAPFGRWFEVRSYPAEDGLSIYLLDVTELKEAEAEKARLLEREHRARQRAEEAAVRESLARATLQTIMDTVPTGIAVTDAATGAYTYVSQEVCRILGGPLTGGAHGPAPGTYQVSRLDGTPFPPEEFPLARVARTGERVQGVEVLVRTPEGREVVVLAGAAPVRDAEGRVTAAVGSVLDITQRRRTEEALRETEARERARRRELEALMEAVPAVIWIAHDPECQRISGSRAAHSVLRLPLGANLSLTAPTEERPTSFRVFQGGTELTPDQLPVQRAARGEEVRDFEESIVFTDGTTRHLVGNATPLLDEQGRPRGAIGAFVDITDRVMAEEALRRSEARRRRFTEANLMGVFEVDAAGTVTVANQAFLSMVGYRLEDLDAGRLSLTTMTPPEYAERDRLGAAEARKCGSCVPYEKELIRRDGSRVPVIMGCTHAGDASSGLVCFALDLTERKRVEHTVTEQRNMLRALIDALPEQIYVKDRQCRFLVANEAVARANSLRSWQELVGKTDFDLFPREEAEVYWAEEQQVLRSGRPLVDIERTAVLGPDEQRHWMVTKVPLRDDRGEVTGLVGINWEVTELRRAQEAQKAANQALQAMVHASPLPMIAVDADERVQLWNPAAETVFGWTAEEVLGRELPTVPEDGWDDYHANRRRMMQGESLTGVELVRRRKDGSLLDVRMWTAPIYDARDQVVGSMGVLEDITEGKRAERERKRLEEQLQQTQRLESLGVLAGGIAHDFNNLLTGVLGNVSLVMGRTPEGSELRSRLQAIETAARRAAQLTNQMLAYSGRGRFVVEPISLSGAVREMVHLLQTSISKKARLSLELQEDLPLLEGDAGQVRQVVMNLILNASEALQERPGRIFVRTGLLQADQSCLAEARAAGEAAPGPYVYLEVTDTGCGMDEATRARLFEPFFTTKFTGRGLGMAAVLGIVKAHRGAIYVWSAPGEGSTFRVLFPATERTGVEASADAPTTVNWRAQGTVLVVDDEPMVRQVATALLESSGFSVIHAADGNEGIETFRRHGDEIAVVLLDLTMPGADGVEVAREMLKLRPGARILLSSGYAAEDVVGRVPIQGIAGYVQKPYTLSDLRNAVRGAMESDA